jgi:2-succinyl-6-hydroxy-2,4-cyclohexadiene-1-carboxylate synthase
VVLAVDAHPRAGAERLVLVHGFTQNGRCWGPLPAELGDRFDVVAVDAPGHGRSDPAHDAASFVDAAALIGEAGGPATYLGYSMGGRLCLQLACDRPDLVHRLVLVGTTAGLRTEHERAARREADDRLAARLERDGLPAFLAEWLALPLFAGLPVAARAVDERLTNRPEGLAASLRHCGTGHQPPQWERLDRLVMPVLLCAGALDTKFVALAGELYAGIAAGRADGELATLRMEVIEGAGHTCHLERPAAFLRRLGDWLDHLPPAPAGA